MRIYPVVFRLLGTEEKQVILGLNLDIKSLSSYHLQLSFLKLLIISRTQTQSHSSILILWPIRFCINKLDAAKRSKPTRGEKNKEIP